MYRPGFGGGSVDGLAHVHLVADARDRRAGAIARGDQTLDRCRGHAGQERLLFRQRVRNGVATESLPSPRRESSLPTRRAMVAQSFSMSRCVGGGSGRGTRRRRQAIAQRPAAGSHHFESAPSERRGSSA